MPVGRDALDRRFLDVDQLHVGLVVDLVVLGLERHAARAEAMVLGDQLLGHRLVFHALADLAGDEVAHHRVGRAVYKYVAEVALPHAEAAVAVELLPQRLALLFRHLGGLARIGRVQEAGEGLAAALEDLRIAPTDLGHLVLGDLGVVQGRAPVGRALEHGEMARRLGDLLDGLHPRGAGADHRHALAFEAHRLVRPARGVAGLALEALDAVDLGHGRRRQRADGGDQEAAGMLAAVLQA